MSRRAVGYTAVALMGLTLAFAGLAVAEDPDSLLDPNEPPVRLKKKHRSDKDAGTDKKPEPPLKDKKPSKDGEAKKPDQPEPPLKDKAGKDGEARKPVAKKKSAEDERKKIVKRLLKNLQQAENQLAKNDPGRKTREIQRDVIKDLDRLIEEAKQPPPKGGGSSSSSSKKSSRNRKSQSQPKNNSGKPKNSDNPKAGQQPKKDKINSGQKNNSGQKKPDKKKTGKKSGKENDPNSGGAGKSNKDRENKLADVFKDVWGHLPETMRQEMDAYTRARFVPEYDPLLRQYYRAISEQGRRKKGD